MVARRESELPPMKNRSTVERKSERELVITRTVNGPARIVFEARGLGTSCSSFDGYRSRRACYCFPARWMFVSEAGTAWCSASRAQRWRSSARTAK